MITTEMRAPVEVNEIYFDLDDVLNQFTGFLGHIFGVAESYSDLSWYGSEFGFDVYAAIASSRTKNGQPLELSFGGFWDVLKHQHWAHIPVQPCIHDLLQAAVDEVGAENVFSATSPTKCPQAASGKVEWLKRVLPEQLQRQWFITPRKWMLSAPGRMLVDDSMDNCEKWDARGGLAMLVPKPWNCPEWQPGDDTEFLKELFQ